MNVYLDNSATTMPRDEVVDKMVECLKYNYGNPSSLHRMGLESEKAIENARNNISKFLNTNKDEIIFTSGGTESNNIAVQGIVSKYKRKGNHIITTKIEHPSVMNIFRYYEQNGFDVTYLNTDEFGLVDLNQLKESMSDRTILVAVMMVNNENGTIQPIEDIYDIVKKANKDTKIHVDGIQAFGKINVNLKKLRIDSFSFSGHKFHAPKGIGGLYLSKELKLPPVVHGSGQESGKRAGTENVPGIVGMGEAAEILINHFEEEVKHIREVKAYFIESVEKNIDSIRINSLSDERCAPHIVNISFMGTKAEVLLHYLENDNIFVSTGSACSSKDKSVSKVLSAMGLKDKDIEGAIRFSFSHNNQKNEIDYVVEKLKNSVEEIRKIMKF